MAESIFCVEGEWLNSCKELDLYTYEDNINLISKVFAIFQLYIPKLAENFTDPNGDPIKILKQDITLTPPDIYPPVGILLQPTDDLSTYDEDFNYENSVFTFEAFLSVRGSMFEENSWNLIRVESIVKTLITGLEQILRNGFTVTFDGFRFLGTEPVSNYYVRTGITRFTLRKRSQPKIIKL